MKLDVLNWSANFITFLVFIYLLITTINTTCFSLTDTLLSLGNLFISLTVYVIDIAIKIGGLNE